MTRQTITLLAICSLLGAASPFAQAPSNPPVGSRGSVRARLIGNWKLVSYVVIDQSGATQPGPYDVGRVVYDATGEMSAHLMNSKRAVANPTTDLARSDAYRSYIGYFGPFTVDEQKGTVTHHVIGSSYPHWAGTDQVRYYALSDQDRHLTLSVKTGDRVTQTLVWERIG